MYQGLCRPMYSETAAAGLSQLKQWTAYIKMSGESDEDKFSSLSRKKQQGLYLLRPTNRSYEEYDRGGKGYKLKPHVFTAIKPFPQMPRGIKNTPHGKMLEVR